MSSSEQTKMSPATSALQQTLRWWPVALLIVSMVFLRKLPDMLESPSLGVLMLSFMGPAGLGILVLLWWVSLSRASMNEKLIGFFAVALIGVITIALSHFSMLGMGTMIFQIPYGTAAFAIPLILLANRPSLRLPIALVATVVGFGYWDLLQTHGVSGRFVSELSWRWEATAEENYLKSRVNKETLGNTTLNEPAITLASAAWPSFRGASRDGKLLGLSLSEDWKASPPKLIWKTKIGPGWSSFSVAGNRLFTQEQRGEKEAVVCLDAKTGQTVWEYEYDSRFWESVAGAGPRATPTIADEGLFSLGANGILACLNASTGAKIWERDIQVDSKRKPPMWGFASSPLITEGVVVVHAGSGAKEEGVLLAYDATTGKPRWSIPSGSHSYSSAQTANLEGVSGVLMETNAGLQFVNAKDGSTIWQFDSPTQNYRTLQPLVIGNSILLANSLNEGTKRLSVTREGESWSVKEQWTSSDMKPDFNDFVEHQGSLYGFDKDIFACIDLATGQRQWKKGRYGNGQVLLLCDADQMLVTSEKGELVLLKADSSKMVELGKIHAIEGKTWNHSVVVGNLVFIRNAEEAACYELPTR